MWLCPTLQAAAIIVMIPDGENARSAADQVAQTAVSLTAACPNLSRQNIVFQASHDHVSAVKPRSTLMSLPAALPRAL